MQVSKLINRPRLGKSPEVAVVEVSLLSSQKLRKLLFVVKGKVPVVILLGMAAL